MENDFIESYEMRAERLEGKRWLIHINSNLISSPTGLKVEAIVDLSRQVADLQSKGIQVLLLSAGAVIAGSNKILHSSQLPPLHEMQAVAAIGQIKHIQTWSQSLEHVGFDTAQILITHDDLSHRKHYLNARSTLEVLISSGVIPIISENGTVASHGVRAGDTEGLGALIVNLVAADVYVMLTELEGLTSIEDQSVISLIDSAMAMDSKLDRCAHEMSGRYGYDIRSWVRSARIAARSGAQTVIANGNTTDVLKRISKGESIGTMISSKLTPLQARGQWLSSHLPSRGSIEIIEDDLSIITVEGVTATSVLKVDGTFQRGDVVICRGADGKELVRGLVNYSSQEIMRLRGLFLDEFSKQIGYTAEPFIMSPDNLVASTDGEGK
ncbi:glutamate 5-kinase [Pseudomonas mohnii]